MSNSQMSAAILLAAMTAAGVDPAALTKVAQDAIRYAEEQEQSLEAAEAYNLELQKKLEQASKGGASIPEFAYDGRNFTVEHGINLGGKVYTAAEIAENADVQKQLVDSGSSAVAEVPAEASAE